MKIKTLEIEWKHLDVEGKTCNRCNDTGKNLYQEVKCLNEILNPQGIEIVLKETKIDESKILQSNSILLNNTLIEDIIDIEILENYCDSCSTLLGTETFCRMIKYEGNEFDDIPAEAIRKAVYTVLGIEKVETPVAKFNCVCNHKNCC